VVQAARDEGRRPDGLTTDEKDEVRRLRREVRVRREERRSGGCGLLGRGSHRDVGHFPRREDEWNPRPE
jgi:transposase-like protein